MEKMNFHKQKLYSLIFAGVALIALFLPWVSVNMGIFGGGSVNGFRSWGILSFVGVLGVAAACFLDSDKALPFDDTFKKVALGSFGAIALGALIFFIKINDAFGASSGFGLWVALIAGIAGLVWVLGKINLPDIKKPN